MTMALTQVNSDGISDNSIVNADLNSSANIASSKLAKPIDFADNEKARFGASQDLQIYHDGSNSYVDDSGTGDLYIRSNRTRIGKYTGEDSIVVNADGDVELFNDNSKKLETKSNGVRVYGEVHSDGLDVDGDADIAGTVRTNRLVVDDDGSDSPLFAVRADDDNPWAFNVGNDTYASSEGIGYQIYQQSNGSITTQARGDSEYVNWYLTSSNGTTSSTMIHVDTNRSVHLSYQGSTKLSTKSDGCEITGRVYPESNATYDLGASSKRWNNIYTNDLQLSNEGGANEVDGTWGNYTIQEGEDDLFLINRRSGKKYKFMLEEVQ